MIMVGLKMMQIWNEKNPFRPHATVIDYTLLSLTLPALILGYHLGIIIKLFMPLALIVAL